MRLNESSNAAANNNANTNDDHSMEPIRGQSVGTGVTRRACVTPTRKLRRRQCQLQLWAAAVLMLY